MLLRSLVPCRVMYSDDPRHDKPRQWANHWDAKGMLKFNPLLPLRNKSNQPGDCGLLGICLGFVYFVSS